MISHYRNLSAPNKFSCIESKFNRYYLFILTYSSVVVKFC